MVIGQTKKWYWPDKTDRNMGIGQTEVWVLPGANRPKHGHLTGQKDRIWVLARPNSHKHGYWHYLDMGIGQA